MSKRKQKLVEVCCSFSYKLNIPGAYESRDFFCSQKSECSPKKAEKTAETLSDFCKNQVIKQVNKYIADKNINQNKEMTKPEPSFKRSAQGYVAKSDVVMADKPEPVEPPLPVINEEL